MESQRDPSARGMLLNSHQPRSADLGDPQLQEYLAGVRQRLRSNQEAYEVLQDALRNKPRWVQELIFRLLADEVHGSFSRIADNVSNFKQCLQKYADLVQSDTAREAKSFLQDLKASDLAALHREARNIKGHLDRLAESSRNNDFDSVVQISSVITNIAVRFTRKFARLKPVLEKLASMARDLAKEFRSGAGTVDQDMRNVSARRDRWTNLFDWFDTWEEDAGKVLLWAAAGCGLTLLGALGLSALLVGLGNFVATLGGIGALVGFFGLLGTAAGSRAGSGEVAMCSAPVAVSGFGVALVSAGVSNALTAMSAAIIAVVPGLQAVAIGSAIVFALFLVGAVGRRALKSLLMYLWQAELEEQQRLKEAFDQMAHHVQGLVEVCERSTAIGEALEVIEEMSQGMSDAAEDCQHLCPPEGPVAEAAMNDTLMAMGEMESDMQRSCDSCLELATKLTLLASYPEGRIAVDTSLNVERSTDEFEVAD